MPHKKEEDQQVDTPVVVVGVQSPTREGLDFHSSQMARFQSQKQLLVLLPQQGPDGPTG